MKESSGSKRAKKAWRARKIKTEKQLEAALRKYLEVTQKGRWVVLQKQKMLPPIKNIGKRAMPDVIAYKKNEGRLYIFEVKKGSSPRNIGQAFGQLLADECIYENLRNKNRKELKKFLQKNFPKDNLQKLPEPVFCVAFYHYSIKKHRLKSIVRELNSNLKNFRAWIVYNKRKVKKIKK